MKTKIATAGALPSRYQIDDVVYMHPKIEGLTANQTRQYGLKALVVGANFKDGKVLYELALDTSTDPENPNFYTAIPVAAVDSYFVISEADLQRSDNGHLAVAANRGERTPNEIRKFAQRYQTFAQDLPELRKELARV